MNAYRPRSAVAIALIVLLGGCWPFGRDEEESGPQAPQEPPRAVVTNMHWAAVNVFVVYRGTNHRLGTLTTSQTERFELPDGSDMGSDVRFIIDPIGSRQGYVTESVYAQGGQEIVVRIENNLNLTSVSIR
jgi:hypothetical protein